MGTKYIYAHVYSIPDFSKTPLAEVRKAGDAALILALTGSPEYKAPPPDAYTETRPVLATPGMATTYVGPSDCRYELVYHPSMDWLEVVICREARA